MIFTVFLWVVFVAACISAVIDVVKAYRNHSFGEATKRVAIAFAAMLALCIFISLCIVWGTSQWPR